MQLVVYENACRAISLARTIDEVKEIGNRAEAARAYAKQAKNRQMEMDAMEIRVRAERRLGQIIIEMKKSHVLAPSGRFPVATGQTRLTLKDIGIDADDSARSQRLATIPDSRLEPEIADWRSRMAIADRMEIPLQNYRIPSIRGDRQRVAHQKGRKRINQGDPLDQFRAPDGRRIADWRIGELERLETLFNRAALCAKTLREEMPVANPDPLATCEMLFKGNELKSLLGDIFEGHTLPQSDAGIDGDRIKASRLDRTRVCENCSKTFVMNHRRNSAGRFCSRECSFAVQRSKSKKKNVGPVVVNGLS